jgi:mono/diheme cytochrome c family protein
VEAGARATGALALLAALAAGCGSARRGEPLAGPLAVAAPEARRGEAVFMRHCHQCHPGGEAGLAPSINDKPVPGFMVKTQVRLGVGAMPGFSREEISPEALDDLVAYLAALRRHRGAPPVAGTR